MSPKLSFDLETDELEIFLEEANEHLQALEIGILSLEQGVEASTLNAIFRAAHTLKALGGTIGHQRLAELTHKMETLFDVMRSGKFSPTRRVVDDLLAAADVLKALLGEIVCQEQSDVDVTGIIARLNAALTADDVVATTRNNQDSIASRSLTPDQINQAGRYREVGQILLEIELNITTDAFAPAARLSQAAMALLEVGQIVAQQPTLTDLANSQHNGALWAVLATSTKMENVRELLAAVSDPAEFHVKTYQLETAPGPASTTKGASPS
jgi:two-component system, chemotaxis family, sensor kinase CheA